jgi:hypothetical protein
MNSGQDNPCGLGYPIRRFQGQSLFAARLNFSQRITSFIASVNLGIRRVPFIYCDCRHRCRPYTLRADLSQPESGLQTIRRQEHTLLLETYTVWLPTPVCR